MSAFQSVAHMGTVMCVHGCVSLYVCVCVYKSEINQLHIKLILDNFRAADENRRIWNPSKIFICPTDCLK